MKNSHHLLIEIILLFVLVIVFFKCLQHRQKVLALKGDRELLQTELHLKNSELNQLKMKKGLIDSLFNKSDIRYFKLKGLQNPYTQLTNSLYQQQQLIPIEGVLGGNMRIWNALLLNRKWAMAYYEDGHRSGSMLLAYSVNDLGEISWRVIEDSE